MRRAAPWLVQRYRYPHAHVELHFFRVFDWEGDPVGHEGQAFAWQTPGKLRRGAAAAGEHPGAARAACCRRSTGSRWRATSARRRFSCARGLRSSAGSRSCSCARRTGPKPRQRALAGALVALARPRGAKVLLNGDARQARAWGCDGVHWTSAALAAATARPARHPLRGVVPHTRRHRAGRDAWSSTSRCSGPCCPRRRTRARRRWDGRGSRRWPPKRRCPSSRRAGSRTPTSNRDRARRARRRAAPRRLAPTDANPRRRTLGRRAAAARLVLARDVGIVGLRRFGDGHAVGLARPGAQIDHLAALRAEGPPARGGRPLDRRPADGAGNDARPRSQIAERQLELHVVLVDGAAVHSGDTDEPDVERVLVRADFRHAGQVVGNREAQQLRDLRRRQHQLEDAAGARPAGSRARCRAAAAG